MGFLDDIYLMNTIHEHPGLLIPNPYREMKDDSKMPSVHVRAHADFDQYARREIPRVIVQPDYEAVSAFGVK